MCYNDASGGGIDADISRVSEIADDAAGATQYAVYSYLGAGTIVKVTHPAVTGGLTLDYGADGSDGFDQFGRVTDQTWTNAAQTSTFDDFTHTYDRASNRLTRDLSLTTGLDEKYTYDELNRLTNTERGTLSGGAITSLTYEQDWTLDELGNWDEFDDNGSTETRTHNQANEIVTTDAGANPTHDAAGNMTFDGTLHYTYDAWNRLVKVHDDNSGSPGDLIATYEFDGQNRRIVETIEGTPDVIYDNYYNANWQLLEVRKDGDVDPLKQFIWDLRYIDSPVVRFHDSDTDGTLDNTLYYTTDANMNVTALVDTSGNVVERYHYDAYGEVAILDADWSSDADGASDVDNRTLFTGYHYDSETGLYLARNRIYHPTLGRFIQRDPAGYIAGMSLYQYVLSRPTTLLDPTGWAPFFPNPSNGSNAGPSPSIPTAPMPPITSPATPPSSSTLPIGSGYPDSSLIASPASNLMQIVDSGDLGGISGQTVNDLQTCLCEAYLSNDITRSIYESFDFEQMQREANLAWVKEQYEYHMERHNAFGSPIRQAYMLVAATSTADFLDKLTLRHIGGLHRLRNSLWQQADYDRHWSGRMAGKFNYISVGAFYMAGGAYLWKAAGGSTMSFNAQWMNNARSMHFLFSNSRFWMHGWGPTGAMTIQNISEPIKGFFLRQVPVLTYQGGLVGESTRNCFTAAFHTWWRQGGAWFGLPGLIPVAVGETTEALED